MADCRQLRLAVCAFHILHHLIIVSISGESFRLKDKRKAGMLAAPAKTAKKLEYP